MSRKQKHRPLSYWRAKSVRDPLFGFIGLTPRETRLIGTRSFLRLGRLKQLSHAYLVYPSAVHTRLEHSLGSMHIADRLSNALEFDDHRREVVRSATLLHDLGHGPFSHLFEDLLRRINGDKFSHESITRMIIKDDAGISKILGPLKNEVIDLLSERREPRREEPFDSLAADIISSGIDADKLDYLRRDSYHIGVAYGSFDLERILHTITSTRNRRSICVDEKGKDAVENYRLGRYLMHAQVYEHHTRIVADQMFLRALEIALLEGKVISKDEFKVGTSDPPTLANNDKFLKNYLELDDNSIYDRIISGRGKSSHILKDIKDRRLLKRACEFEPGFDVEGAEIRREITRMRQKQLQDLRNEIARKSDIDPDLIITHMLTISIKLYGDEILVLRKNRIPEELSRVSPISADPGGVQRIDSILHVP